MRFCHQKHSNEHAWQLLSGRDYLTEDRRKIDQLPTVLVRNEPQKPPSPFLLESETDKNRTKVKPQ